MAADVNIELELVDENVRHGVWCPHCAKPSAFEATFMMTLADAVTVYVLAHCVDCDETWEATG